MKVNLFNARGGLLCQVEVASDASIITYANRTFHLVNGQFIEGVVREGRIIPAFAANDTHEVNR